MTTDTLSKTVTLKEDGTLESDTSQCWLADGNAKVVTFDSVASFAAHFTGMRPSQALGLGTALDGSTDTPITTLKRKNDNPDSTALCRSKDYFDFKAGQEGFLLVDHDTKGMPVEVQGHINAAGGIEAALSIVVPALEAAPTLTRQSTSACLMNKFSGQTYGGGGFHKYIGVQDVSVLARATKAYHQRAWLLGFGWFMISKSGALLERSIVDVSVGSPERLVFEADPIVGQGLEINHDARGTVVTEGEPINTREAIPSLSARETAEYNAKVSAARKALEPEAAAVRAAFIDKLARRISKRTKTPITTIKARLEGINEGTLPVEHPLFLDDGSEVTVGDVLANPKKYDRATLADPLEPSYGRAKAILYAQKNGGVTCTSQAHGLNATYQLMHSLSTITQVWEKFPIADEKTGAKEQRAYRWLITAIATSQLEAWDEAELIERIASNAPTGRKARALRTAVKTERQQMAQAKRRTAKPEGEAEDSRPRVFIGSNGGPLTEPMQRVDAALLELADREPPTRNLAGSYTILRHQSMGHVVGGSADDEAPTEPVLAIASDLEAAVDVEKYVTPLTHDRRGDPVEVAMFPRLASAYRDWSESKLPRVSGVATLPLVFGDRQLNGIGAARSRCSSMR